MQATPLQQAHQKLNAAFSEVAGWAIPEHFGNVAAEYDAARTGAAIADASHHGRIVARGKDTLDLLNRLSTNLVDPLPPDAGQSTVVTTGKGRVVDWITVLPWADDVLLLTAPERRAEVAEWIDMFTFDEDTTLEDVTESTAMLSILGPSAESLVEQLLGFSVDYSAGVGLRGCAMAARLCHRRENGSRRAAGVRRVRPRREGGGPLGRCCRARRCAHRPTGARSAPH